MKLKARRLLLLSTAAVLLVACGGGTEPAPEIEAKVEEILTAIPTIAPTPTRTPTPSPIPTPLGTDPMAFHQCATQAVGEEIASNTVVIEDRIEFLGGFDTTGMTDGQFDALFICAEQEIDLPAGAFVGLADLGQAVTATPTPALTTNSATIAWLEGVGWSESKALGVAEKVRASTLIVRAASSGGGTEVGTGWVAAPDLVVTNGHVTPEVGTTVSLETITGAQLSALVLESSLIPDLAVLRVTSDLSLLPPQLPLGSALPGNLVMAVGHPSTVGNWVVTVGEVVSVDPDVWILADVSVAQGNSGGPAVNRNGEVIGVVSGSTTSGDVSLTGVYDLVIIRDLKDYALPQLTTIEPGGIVAAMVQRHQ